MKNIRLIIKVGVSVLLVCLMVFTSLSIINVKTIAATDFTFDITTGYITGYNASANDVVIPDEIAGYTIRGITSGCFKDKDIRTIQIPDTVTEIESEVFMNCSHLKEINMSSNITSIGENAFYGCTALKKVEIPYSVETVGSYAFAGCTSLKQAIIPYSVTSIGEGVFSGCSSIVSIVYQAQEAQLPNSFCENCISLSYFDFPEHITEIGESAFKGCKSLQSISLPNNVDTIGHGAYKDCIGIKTLYIPDTVSIVGYKAFSGCTGLKNAVLNNESFYNASGCSDSGSKAFENCTSLTDVKFQDNTTSIGEETFLGCGALTHIEIPTNVVTIPDNAFNGCNSNLVIHCNKNSEALAKALALGVDYSYEPAPYFDNTAEKPSMSKDIDVSINEKFLFFDQEPIIENGRTLVPLRIIFEELGAEVEWDGNTRTVTAKKGNIMISLRIDDDTMYKNDSTITLDVPATIKNGRTLVPVRAVSEAFDCIVEWNADMRTVIIEN